MDIMKRYDKYIFVSDLGLCEIENYIRDYPKYTLKDFLGMKIKKVFGYDETGLIFNTDPNKILSIRNGILKKGN